MYGLKERLNMYTVYAGRPFEWGWRAVRRCCSFLCGLKVLARGVTSL